MNSVYQCLRPECRFRFASSLNSGEHQNCPKCGSPTRLIVLPYDGIRIIESNLPASRQKMVTVLDNIRSTFNVGSIIRTADGANIDHLYLCGITPTPDHPKIAKTALGAEAVVGWSQHWNTLELLIKLKSEGYRLLGLECVEDSRSIFDYTPAVDFPATAIIIGSEISGLDPEILRYCDEKIHIPMYGMKRSLNVSVAFGVFVYFLRYHQNNPY